MTYSDHMKRSFVKSLTWRFLATFTTVSLVLIFTGNLELAGIVGVFDIIIKLMVYFFHERAWNKVHWGKE